MIEIFQRERLVIWVQKDTQYTCTLAIFARVKNWMKMKRKMSRNVQKREKKKGRKRPGVVSIREARVLSMVSELTSILFNITATFLCRHTVVHRYRVRYVVSRFVLLYRRVDETCRWRTCLPLYVNVYKCIIYVHIHVCRK